MIDKEKCEHPPEARIIVPLAGECCGVCGRIEPDD